MTTDFISSSNLRELEEALSASLDYRIAIQEFESVVKNLRNNKSPRWDDLTAEFYKIFWEDINYQGYTLFSLSRIS